MFLIICRIFRESTVNRRVLQHHYDYLKDLYQLTAEKLRHIKMEIKFLIHTEESDDGTRTLDMLSQWIKTLSKPIGKQCQQHGLRVRDELANNEPTRAASKFLKN